MVRGIAWSGSIGKSAQVSDSCGLIWLGDACWGSLGMEGHLFGQVAIGLLRSVIAVMERIGADVRGIVAMG